MHWVLTQIGFVPRDGIVWEIDDEECNHTHYCGHLGAIKEGTGKQRIGKSRSIEWTARKGCCSGMLPGLTSTRSKGKWR